MKIAPESDPEAAAEVIQDVPIVMQSIGLTSPATALVPPAYGASLVAALATAVALVLLH